MQLCLIYQEKLPHESLLKYFESNKNFQVVHLMFYAVLKYFEKHTWAEYDEILECCSFTNLYCLLQSQIESQSQVCCHFSQCPAMH